MLFSKKLDPELYPGLHWCPSLASGLRAVTFKQGWRGKENIEEGEKQCSIPAYDAHYILERKKRDGVKYLCNPCYVPYGPVRAIPLHQTYPGHPIPYGCNKQAWIHVPNVCFQLQRTTDPPNPTQMSAATKDPAVSGGSKQPCKCTLYNIVQCTIFQLFACSCDVVWVGRLPLEVCIHLAHPFLPNIWRYLVSHDVVTTKSLGCLQGLICPILGQISPWGEIICPREGLIMEANYRLKYPYYLVAAWRKFTGMKTVLSPIYLPLLIALK